MLQLQTRLSVKSSEVTVHREPPQDGDADTCARRLAGHQKNPRVRGGTPRDGGGFTAH